MGASNTPLYDLVELQGLLANTTYTTAPGGGGDIVGLVDNATYTDSHTGNSSTEITELNTTADADNGVLTIDGVVYDIQVVTPATTSSPVTVTYDGGSTVVLTGDHFASQVAFIVATPTGGGSTRWFMAVDDSVGDLPDITSIQITGLDFAPTGQDVRINLDENDANTVCFAAGTWIRTPQGERRVEDISPGELVDTLDHGAQPVLWRHAAEVALAPGDARAPVILRRGALGLGLPERDLVVSPQHRVLLRSKITLRMLGRAEVLVPAVKLVGLSGVARSGAARVTYVHLFCGGHEILFANGAPAESLLPDAEALDALPEAARAGLEALLEGPVRPARPILERGKLLARLLARHRKNARPLCEAAAGNEKGREVAPPALKLVAG